MADQPRKSFAEMRAELAKQRGRPLDPPKQTERALKSVPMDEDLVPDVLGDRSEEDLEVDSIVNSIDVLHAYRKWIGKEVDERTTGSKEGIKVSCPIPGHRDKNPSAWLNTDKKTWFCGGCQEGGDLYDLAAIKFGYARPDYKDGKTFHDLRKEMAESYGYRFKTVSGKEIIWRESEEGEASPSDSGTDVRDGELAGTPDEPPVQPADDASTESSVDTGSPVQVEEEGSVTPLRDSDVDDEPEEEIRYPHLNWRHILPEDTFLYEYCKATSNDDSPEEYHFWHGLLAVGHAVGRNVSLNDTRPVYANLLVCLLGGTGFGKSRARAWLDDLLDEALPFTDNGLDTTGCKLVPVPASGENLINQFQHIASDPSVKLPVTVRTSVNGIVDYDEFAGLLARASRPGATLKQIIMAFSDSRPKISTSSNTGGTYEAYRPFCSITASTQPKAVRPLLSRTDTSSGFLNRWIFVGGPRKEREVIGGTRSAIRVDLSVAVDKLKKLRGWGATTRDVHFTDDGYEAFEKFVKKQVFPLQIADESDLLTRLDLTMKRMVLLFCINEKKVEADEDLVNRTIPVLNYLIDCYRILNAEIGITQISEITTEIMRHIKRIQEQTGRGASARDLGLRMKRKNYSPDLIKRALETMIALDWIDLEKNKGPGRPSIRYRVVA